MAISDHGGRVSVIGPDVVLGLLLWDLMLSARRWAGSTPFEAVIAMPLYFSEEQRKETLRVASQIGLQPTSAVEEPVASTLAFRYDTHLRPGQDSAPLILYDFGAGSLDVSVVRFVDEVSYSRLRLTPLNAVSRSRR